MRRSIWYRCGGFHIEAAGFEDLYFFILVRECGEFEYLAEPLAKFRLSSPEIGPDKWSPKVFLQLVKGLYGGRARGLIAEVRGGFAGAFASKPLWAMKTGNRNEAVRCGLNVFRYDRLYPLRASHLGRLFRRRNLRLLARMLRSKLMGELE